MIPKTVHYCWLSKDKYPQLIEKCNSSWKKNLPDYEFIHWDTNRFNVQNNIWVYQAFAAKKYAFAADYLRLYAVYNYGGIYLDMDVEVLKNFDDLLNLPYFIGSEGNGNIEAGIFGGEKGCEWIGKCLEYYDKRRFLKEDGTFDTIPLPRIMLSQISADRKLHEISKNNLDAYRDERINSKLLLFPVDYFCAKNQGTGIIKTTNNTYTIHHFAMSWIPKRVTFLPNIKRRLIKLFGEKIMNTVIKIIKGNSN